MRKFKCSICGYVYDEAVGVPEKGIAPGTKWEELPQDFVCPVCTAPKSVFVLLDMDLSTHPSMATHTPTNTTDSEHAESIRELSAGEISAICYSLAKGCEKQRLMAETEAFNKIADYFKMKRVAPMGKTFGDNAKLLNEDMTSGFATANMTAKAASDRGALRSLVWSEKVSAMMKALLDRFAKEGDAMLENTKIFVCDICGFMMLGNAPPDICPVCKVPNYKITQIERR